MFPHKVCHYKQRVGWTFPVSTAIFVWYIHEETAKVDSKKFIFTYSYTTMLVALILLALLPSSWSMSKVRQGWRAAGERRARVTGPGPR